jgi:OmcA/MtrC family decaheme c-type cytochrome
VRGAVDQQRSALESAANELAAAGGAGQCTAVTVFSVPIVGPDRKGTLKSRQLYLRLRAKGQSKYRGVDDDTYRLVCLPSTSQGTNSTTTTTTIVTSGTTSTTLPSGPTGIPQSGLKAQISAAAVSGGGVVTVTFTLTDDGGVPLIPVAAATTDPARARVRFTIARLETVDQTSQGFTTTFTRYRNYITRHVTNSTTHLASDQPTLDSGGTFATVDALAGVYTYTFNTALPPGYPANLTHRIGGQVGRTYNGASLVANPIFDFVPAGGTVTTVRELTTIAQCNSCHDPLAVHGGGRRDVRLCQTCHTDQAIDVNTGNTIDFKVMIHRIHDGKDLPSVAAGPVGTTYGISSTVWAEKVKACVGGPLAGVKCTADADCGVGGTCTGSKVDGVGFPQDIRNCTKCHAAGATVDNFRSKPSAQACASCHDNVNPGLTATAAGAPGTGHVAGAQSDAVCTVCHKPTEDTEYDITVPGAHTVPEQSTQLAGLSAQIVSATGAPAGPVTVKFKLTDGSGSAITSLAAFNRVAFAFNGPTTPDFGSTTSPSPAIAPTAVGGGSSGTLTGPDGSGVFTYVTSAGNSLPANAAGTWRIGIEARRSVTVGQGTAVGPKTLNEAPQNAVLDFSVDGSPVQARRTAVDIANCQSCHGTFSKGFSIHGNLRNQTQYCVLCHNPSMSDFAQRKNVANADPNDESIDLKHLIHKIHTGENLTNAPYIIYGFGGSPNDFSDVRFPGDRRDCAKCHAGQTYLLPLPAGAHATLLTQVSGGVETLATPGSVPPTQDACLACHDGSDVKAHAETNTTNAGAEACGVCHGEGAIEAVSQVHAIGP